VNAPRVTGDFFDVFGVAPLAGRWINRADDVVNGAPVIVLSYGLWQRSFGGDSTILGQTVTSDGLLCTIVGIMPSAFTYPTRAEAWVPLASNTHPDGNFLRLVGRMDSGTTLSRTADDLKAVTAAFNRQNGVTRETKVYLLHDFLSAGNRQMLLVLQGAVLLVLLVACANVANMLLARSVARRRELSIRSAIGAGPARIVRQLLTESLLLAVLGGAVGVLLSSWLLRLFMTLAPAGFGGVQTIAIDRHVLWFTLGVAAATGIVFGLAPARRGFQIDANDGLRDAGTRSATGGGRGVSRLLVMIEIGLAIVLVVGAGLMVKSLIRLQAQDTGFRSDRLLTFQVALPVSRYDDERSRHAVSRMLAEIRALRGVKAAGAINYLPLTQFGFNGGFSIQGRPPIQADRSPIAELRMVTPGYFAAMNIPVRRGAEFTERETMARHFWPNEDPIGARVQLDADSSSIVREVVAVVGDVRSQALNRPPVPETYLPYAQVPVRSMGFAVRTEGDPALVLPSIRSRFGAIDPDLPLVRPQTMTEVVD
jgi:putative ABC transport system permease protein